MVGSDACLLVLNQYVTVECNASDIVRWCDFAQLTSCRIQSHNQQKNCIIAQCREKGSDIKFSGKKNTAAFLNLVQVTHDMYLM